MQQSTNGAALTHKSENLASLSDPINKLLDFGSCPLYDKNWPDYRELGLGKEHIPSLIKIATDEKLHHADSRSVKVYAPVHAWRALGQLSAEEAIDPLMCLLEELYDSDWVGEELPIVYGMIGPKAIPTLEVFLSKASKNLWARVTVAHCLECIGNAHPPEKKQCVLILRTQLERFRENDDTLNGFLSNYLTDLGDPELLGVAKKTFSEERVDLQVVGDYEDLEIKYGVKNGRSKPRKPLFPLDSSLLPGSVMKTLKNKVGRNDPCPCGSGKKHKKCCLHRNAI